MKLRSNRANTDGNYANNAMLKMYRNKETTIEFGNE